MLKEKEMNKGGHVPIRMCIGCRKKRKKEEMLRFVQNQDGVVCVDEKKKMSGRGFYLCPDLNCLRRAQKKEKRWGDAMKSMGLLYLFREGLD
jgi:predicted RNA-binding protein YlxR (DUF448 family)